MRIGLGFDSHRLVEGRKLIIGGVHIPYEKGLAGHSDADVLLHAITDALIGAIGLTSIGELFPDTDEAYKDADSANLLHEVYSFITDKGYQVVNVDCTLLAEEPKLIPYRDKMRAKIAGIIGIEHTDVAIKPKRGEGMGFVGRKEGIAALAVVLLERIKS
ncbi:2-C-methyl-D-erythritol 2,4-cyclodiphosphate synthase [candidate division WOR-3 bacterium]|uniref:2-C-methyl-D-erythritol 2,4-cyclodiphosphate synthase n=1 Tax=candidate division WOR-3 bacterium TaxID=2052148 RepID=A0A9D5QD33_UNCW3|nr:2-C-methyl-D-erythritol 2,4-cyclodiphosphate synthase [candidate division WOR-3 bacterium]MBD3365204.1 2-C-methyl-D-erythritol 2,4-cyclodiphosphate synthase [candidate division WOR-3 bacterium]